MGNGYTKEIDGYWATSTKQLDDTWQSIERDEEGKISSPLGLVEQLANEVTDAKEAEFRAERDKLLADTDIEINKAEDNGEDTTKLRQYRQALRDATIEWVLPTKEG